MDTQLQTNSLMRLEDDDGIKTLASKIRDYVERIQETKQKRAEGHQKSIARYSQLINYMNTKIKEYSFYLNATAENYKSLITEEQRLGGTVTKLRKAELEARAKLNAKEEEARKLQEQIDDSRNRVEATQAAYLSYLGVAVNHINKDEMRIKITLQNSDTLEILCRKVLEGDHTRLEVDTTIPELEGFDRLAAHHNKGELRLVVLVAAARVLGNHRQSICTI